MTYYPNIIYHADTDFIFLDSLQQIGTIGSCEIVEYKSSLDGTIKSFTRGKSARNVSLAGKIQNTNVHALRRKLEYLLGEEVYVMLGAENLATLAKLQDYSFDRSIKTYTPLSLNIVCESAIEGQFYEAEDSDNVSNSTTTTADSNASGGYCEVGSVQGGSWVLFRVTQSDYELPVGDYTFFARMKDTNQVANDVAIEIYNESDSTYLETTETKTLTASYALYTMTFSVASDDVGDTIRFKIYKAEATTNSISIDFFGFVKN